MAEVSGGRLAAAVTAAGGLGLIGGGYGDAEWLQRQFDEAQGARVGIGFITWSLARNPELLDMALARQPATIMLSFGDPGAFAETIHQADIPLIYQVQTLEQARRALEVGSDVIVAQGGEAGGHGMSARSTFTLVPDIVDLVAKHSAKTLVVAAGGVADGRGLAAGAGARRRRRAGRHPVLGQRRRRWCHHERSSEPSRPAGTTPSARGSMTLCAGWIGPKNTTRG